MKHDVALREAAERVYYNHNLEPDSSFEKAEKRRDPEYLAAIDAAVELRRAMRDYEVKMRQLPLF